MTAVEWLFEKLWQLPKDKFTWYNVLEEAKQMEKEQIMKAYYDGQGFPANKTQQINYYNETYGSKGSDERIVEATKTIISQTEISDEEIEEMLFHHSNEYAYGFKDAIKWYREQLKSK